MTGFKITLPKPKRGKYITLYVICCLHIGHKNFDKKKALELRARILKDPNAYVINLGDDIENALPDDAKGHMMFDTVQLPSEQLSNAKAYWLPLAQAGKILITHDSNHWWRSQAKTGISIAKQLNEYLNMNAPKGKGPHWGEWQCLWKLKVGDHEKIIHSWHGAGGGSAISSALNKAMKIRETANADIYIRGHDHKGICYKCARMEFREEDFQPREYLQTFICVPSFLMWSGGYGERAGYGPLMRGGMKILFAAEPMKDIADEVRVDY